MLELLVLLWVGLLILIHESGHLLAGLALKADVRQVNIGLGPGLRFNRFNLEWRIGILPLGGAVHFEENQLAQLHPLKRILISAAGPAANLFTAVLCVMALRGEEMGYGAAAVHAVSISGQVLELTGRALASFDIGSLHGPVSIAAQADAAFRGSWKDIALFSAVGHYGLFALNVLPLPILDGGRIVIAFYELVLRRSFPPQVRKTALVLSALFIALVLLAVTVKDLGQFLAR